MSSGTFQWRAGVYGSLKIVGGSIGMDWAVYLQPLLCHWWSPPELVKVVLRCIQPTVTLLLQFGLYSIGYCI